MYHTLWLINGVYRNMPELLTPFLSRDLLSPRIIVQFSFKVVKAYQCHLYIEHWLKNVDCIYFILFINSMHLLKIRCKKCAIFAYGLLT